jgi:hypothetical protein
MSISTMTTIAYRRRNPATGDLGGDRVRSGSSAAATQAGEVPETQSGVSSALSTITAYVPTEILITYVAVIAAIAGATAGTSGAPSPQGLWVAFIAFLIATPVIVWLVYAGKLRTAGKPLPRGVRDWPRWEMVAATAGYAAWAFALPSTPFAHFAWYNPGVAGVTVLITATMLGLLTPVVLGQPAPAPAPAGPGALVPAVAAAAAAGPEENVAASPIPSTDLADFLPSRSGFRFPNSFPHEALVTVQIPGLATLPLGDAANGLCGGMAFTVRDLFEASVPPPPDTEPPAPGSARYDYLVERQIASLDFGRVPLQLYALGSPLLPDAIPDLGEIAAFGIVPHGRSQVMVLDAWPAIRAELDSGHPSVLGLVRTIDADPTSLGRDHQILAYGYRLAGDEVSIAVYDSNHPGDDTVRLSLRLADPAAPIDVSYSPGDGPVHCFIHIPYAAADPAPWR